MTVLGLPVSKFHGNLMTSPLGFPNQMIIELEMLTWMSYIHKPHWCHLMNRVSEIILKVNGLSLYNQGFLSWVSSQFFFEVYVSIAGPPPKLYPAVVG